MGRGNKIVKDLKRIIEAYPVFLNDLFDTSNNIVLADEIFICDGKGTVVQISETYEKKFGFEIETVIGKSIFDLESEGVFKPSVCATVIRTKKKVITTQIIRNKYQVFATALPVFDDNNELAYVIAFNTITKENIHDMKESLARCAAELRELQQRSLVMPDLIIKSKSMQDMWNVICQTVNTKVNILITGETGVGKSVVAKAIHDLSDRSDRPFVEINCGVIHENLIESELFGYEKGAFTGASSSGKIGKIELANHGTLFLDEIGELPLHIQTKLLQLIQHKTIERISGNKKITVDFKLICATNKELEKEVEAGRFRRDLYYRLNVLRLEIPPLRQRKDDIVILAQKFVSRMNAEYNKNKKLSPRLFDFLESYHWPGNVRQLENLIERLVVSSFNEVIDVDDLPYEIMNESHQENETIITNGNLFERLDEYERRIIVASYSKYRTTVAVAKDLGISQATAARKIAKYFRDDSQEIK